MKGVIWAAAGVAACAMACAAVVDCFDWADKVLNVISRASYELNAIKTGAEAVQAVAVSFTAVVAGRWLLARRKP